MYSELVSDANRCPSLKAVQKPQQFGTVARARALAPYKLRYDTVEDAETKVHLLIAKINSLPAGTFFSVGALAQSANQAIAGRIGKEIRQRCTPGGAYVLVSTISGKCIYQRTDKHPEKVSDFVVVADGLQVATPPLSPAVPSALKKEPSMKILRNVAGHVYIDFSTSLANILRHVYGIKYFPSKVIETPALGLPEGDYAVHLGWRLHYPQGPFALRLKPEMNNFDVCCEIAKLFETQYGIKDGHNGSAVVEKPMFLDEEIHLMDYEGGFGGKSIVSTPFLEGIVIDDANKVIQVQLGT